MKITKISKQLHARFILLIGSILLIASAGLYCINLLKNTSSDIVFEYKELDAVHSLKNSFTQSFIPAYNFLIYKDTSDLNHFKNHIQRSRSEILHCKKLLRSRHNKDLLAYFNQYLDEFEKLITLSEHSSVKINNNRELIIVIDNMLHQADLKIDELLEETEKEINAHIITYETASKHSSLSIFLLTILIFIIGVFQVLRLIRHITSPLDELINVTQKVSKGNFNTKANIRTNDEFQILGKSFNNMVYELNKSTVSINYFNNILSSMYESVIVSDEHGIISMVNMATESILGYSQPELINSSVEKLIYEKDTSNCINLIQDLNNKGIINNLEKRFLSKNKEYIPVLFSASQLSSPNKGYVFVAHDIRERKKIYRELETQRKKHLIDINEAQESERLRIAQDIHDGLGHILTAISYYIDNNINNTLDINKIGEHNKKLQELISKAIKESKNIAFDLIPILLKDFGLAVAVENLIEQTNKQYNKQFVFKTFNLTKRLDAKLEKALYRIVQEAINNIVKHSESTKAFVQFFGYDESIAITITDEGIGFNYNEKIKQTKGRGIGLISMKERVEAYNGIFELISDKNSGTEILIEIPLN